MTGKPDDGPIDLSVVIASINGRPYLDACLEALARQQGPAAAEVIVVDCVGPAVTDFVRQRYPKVRLIECRPPCPLFELRAAGFAAAQAPIVALTEDHCIPADSWVQALLQAHNKHAGPVIGGAVENGATGRTVDRAVYLLEYGRFAGGGSPGPTDQLAGANLSFKRGFLSTLAGESRAPLDENRLQAEAVKAGYSLWFDPAIVVRHKKNFSLPGFCRERFHFSRWYAGNRAVQAGPGMRWFYFLAAPLLPGLVKLRLIHQQWRRGSSWGEWLQASPYMVLFLLVEAAGEAVGSLLGPGDSVYHLR